MDSDLLFVLNTMWTLIAAILVFIMHAGFSLVEVGFTQSKNAINIIMKNFITICIGVMSFYFVGYAFMYGGEPSDFIGLSGFCLTNVPKEMCGISFDVYFFFQAIFCATCATIVSGAMAERTKFYAYIAFCIAATCIIYPMIGRWIWNSGGFLNKMGFIDFAGGTAVHALGGVAALIGAKMVGPRNGKYKQGKVKAIPGHNIPLGALGVLLLWFGWFGFNPGSSLDITSSVTAHAAITTLLGGATGTIAAMVFSSIRYGKPDAGLTLNGALAGLVIVTAGASVISYPGAIIMGLIGGSLMILSVEFLDTKLKIDDPVGAVSVHGLCGSLGTIFIGIFSQEGGLIYGGGFSLLGIQCFGLIICLVTGAILFFITFKIIDKTIGLRVDTDEEQNGLDVMEHNASAYTIR